MKDTKNIVVIKRFSFTKRARCALLYVVDETPAILFKYFEIFFKTYAALPYIIAALSNVDKAIMHLE